VLMDQSSQDDTLVGVGPPGPSPWDAVSRQSSGDKLRKRSQRETHEQGGNAISFAGNLTEGPEVRLHAVIRWMGQVHRGRTGLPPGQGVSAGSGWLAGR
jgi:hypothetical protein